MYRKLNYHTCANQPRHVLWLVCNIPCDHAPQQLCSTQPHLGSRRVDDARQRHQERPKGSATITPLRITDARRFCRAQARTAASTIKLRHVNARLGKRRIQVHGRLRSTTPTRGCRQLQRFGVDGGANASSRRQAAGTLLPNSKMVSQRP